MVSKWRPAGFNEWELPRTKIIKQLIDQLWTTEKDIDIALFEAGADAMLEALRKRGFHVDEDASFSSLGQQTVLSNKDNTGNYVFIPDDDVGNIHDNPELLK